MKILWLFLFQIKFSQWFLMMKRRKKKGKGNEKKCIVIFTIFLLCKYFIYIISVYCKPIRVRPYCFPIGYMLQIWKEKKKHNTILTSKKAMFFARHSMLDSHSPSPQFFSKSRNNIRYLGSLWTEFIKSKRRSKKRKTLFYKYK